MLLSRLRFLLLVAAVIVGAAGLRHGISASGEPARKTSAEEPSADQQETNASTNEQDAADPQFIPVDTTRLMGSPHPEPLKAERVFPQLTFERPIELAYAGEDDQRLFVAEQRGLIRVFANEQDVRETKVFLDIRDAVSRRHNEEGLLGLAFHPDYKNNREFYVYYSTWPRASIVSRFRVSKDDPDRADRDSEEILLRIPQPYGNHNGGSIKFGPEGYLYIGMGDGGLAFDPHENGQDLTTLLGSILRIDVDRSEGAKPYAIPDDNPFADRGEGIRGEIWAYGFRNVWRLAFDRETGQLWAGDVGQDVFEEVDRVLKGGNYGWNRREGFHPFDPDAAITGDEDDLLPPVAEYFHGDGESVTGGIVYRGPRLPEFDGAYFYADFTSGMVWAVPRDQQALDGRQAPVATSNAGMDTTSTRYGRLVARTGLQISAFAEDAAGHMYLLVFGGGIYRLAPEEPDSRRDGNAFPQTLSETGLFADVPKMKPADGLIPYRVNMPLWSDGSLKERYLALPKKQSVVFDAKEKWKFPVGTVFVKTFFQPTAGDWYGNPLGATRPVDPQRQITEPLPKSRIGVHPKGRSANELKDPRDKLHRLETRLFVHTSRGWRGHTYVWNDEQTEADLLHGSLEKPYVVETSEGADKRQWYFPSSVDCLACHTKAAGFVLGPKTAQLNVPYDYDRFDHGGYASGIGRRNQVAHWRRLGLFANDPPADPSTLVSFADWRDVADADERLDDSRSLGQLARAYLDVNCSICHRPDGITREIEMDLRSETPLDKTALLGKQVRQGQLSPRGSSRIAAGEPYHSEILYRMRARGHRQMPPLATHVPDRQALRIIRRWIEELDVAP